MRKAEKAAVINISSVAGLMPVAFMGAYSAAKGALLMFSESLRTELKPEGIMVSTICPGRIPTDFSSRAVNNMPVPKTPGQKSVSHDAYGEMIYRVYRKRKRRVIFPCWYHLVIGINRLFPAISENFSLKIWKKS